MDRLGRCLDKVWCYMLGVMSKPQKFVSVVAAIASVIIIIIVTWRMQSIVGRA